MGMKYLLKMQSREDPPIWSPFVHLYFIYLWVYFFPYGIFPFNSQYFFFSFLKCSFLFLSPSSKCIILSSFSITKQNFPEQHQWKPSYMPYAYLISSKVSFFFLPWCYSSQVCQWHNSFVTAIALGFIYHIYLWKSLFYKGGYEIIFPWGN